MAPSTRTDLRPTRVCLAPSPDGGPPLLHLATGLLAPRVLRRTTSAVQVALVATTAALLGGDRLELDVEVGEGLRLDLTDVAGTVAYHGRGRLAHVSVHLRIAAGATLVWAGEPLVVADGAQVERHLDVDVADTGFLLLRDVVALGRVGERGGSLLCDSRMAYAGRPALVEALDLRSAVEREEAAFLAHARVVDTVTALGWRPDAATPPGSPGASVYRLSVPGAQARALVAASHESVLPSLWGAWSATLRVRNAGWTQV